MSAPMAWPGADFGTQTRAGLERFSERKSYAIIKQKEIEDEKEQARIQWKVLFHPD